MTDSDVPSTASRKSRSSRQRKGPPQAIAPPQADRFNARRDFHSLSLSELLRARDAYHVHLAHMANVVATAVGLYRIRRDEDKGAASIAANPQSATRRQDAPPRTLQNSTTQEWSWPCILVFVDRWQTLEEMRQNPDQVVPRLLYLEDGLVVPTCVVLAEQQQAAPPPLQNLAFPSSLLGGGYPCLTDVQGQEHVGSLGCIVSDGDMTYALTNRHVTGEPGREVFSLLDGERVRIGVSDARQVGKIPFADAFPGWHGENVLATLDAGLIRVDNAPCWTAQVYGVGELDTVVDLNTNTLSLDLIGCPVMGFGCGSGEMRGEIQALFYRYRSLGGLDYVADFLIGSRQNAPALQTRPGDSGTLWLFDPEQPRADTLTNDNSGLRAPRLRPLALQWGGHSLLGRDGASDLQFALATTLSTVCRTLDVEVVRDWNIGHREYWGQTGHYKIGATACDLVVDPALQKLMTSNRENIAFRDEAIKTGNIRRDPHQFVPLADVADLVWRNTRKKDEANHFADMDEPGEGAFAGQTLLDLCQDDANIDIDVWNRFYDSLNKDFKRGALPFRVWQIYQAMVEFVQQREIEKFVCAAGVLAHYCGDACQPLHVSYLHHGRPDHPEEKPVHSMYETQMLDRRAAEMIAGVNGKLQQSGAQAQASITGGRSAAKSVIELMRQTFQTLPPIEVVDAFNAASGQGRVAKMWEALGDRTCACIASGCVALASVWESAWHEGGGSSIDQNAIGKIDEQALMDIYNDVAFLRSLRLQEAGWNLQ